MGEEEVVTEVVHREVRVEAVLGETKGVDPLPGNESGLHTKLSIAQVI